MDLQGWIDRYEKKTGEKFQRMKGFELLFFPDKGFCEISIDNGLKSVLVHRVCGDLKSWRMVIESIMQLCGYKRMTTLCIRHIRPYMRLLGLTVVNSYPAEFGTAYDVEFEGGKGCCYPVRTISDDVVYFMSLEVM